MQLAFDILADRPITFDAMKIRASNVRDRAARLTESIRAEARAESKRAGLDPNLLGIHPHNAMCSFEAGTPWSGVNYARVRRVLWLLNKSYEPGRLADRIVGRLIARVRW